MGNFKINGLSELINDTSSIEKRFKKKLQEILIKHGMKLVRSTKKLTPVDTGILRRSWQYESNGLYFEIFSNVEYGLHIEYGHRVGKTNKVIEGHYMLTKSFEKVEKSLIKDIEKLIINLWGN